MTAIALFVSPGHSLLSFGSPFGFSFVFVFIGFVFLFFDINKTRPPGVTQGVTRRTLVDDPNRYTK